jgi:hypothetical protein
LNVVERRNVKQMAVFEHEEVPCIAHEAEVTLIAGVTTFLLFKKLAHKRFSPVLRPFLPVLRQAF